MDTLWQLIFYAGIDFMKGFICGLIMGGGVMFFALLWLYRKVWATWRDVKAVLENMKEVARIHKKDTQEVLYNHKSSIDETLRAQKNDVKEALQTHKDDTSEILHKQKELLQRQGEAVNETLQGQKELLEKKIAHEVAFYKEVLRLKDEEIARLNQLLASVRLGESFASAMK